MKDHIVRCEHERTIQRLPAYDWARDGKSIFYSQVNRESGLSQIFLRKLDSGDEREVYQTIWNEEINFAVSPDGRWLALLNREKDRMIKILSADGGEARDICRFQQPGRRWLSLIWSSDGNYVLYERDRFRQLDESGNIDPMWDLWRVPVEGGEPQRLLSMNGMGAMSIHPAGSAIALSSGGPTAKPMELWVMENFLPKTTEEQAGIK